MLLYIVGCNTTTQQPQSSNWPDNKPRNTARQSPTEFASFSPLIRTSNSSCSAQSATLTRFGCSLAAPDQEHSGCFLFLSLSLFFILCSASVSSWLSVTSTINPQPSASCSAIAISVFFYYCLLSVLAINSPPRWSVRSLTGRKISDVMQDLYAS